MRHTHSRTVVAEHPPEGDPTRLPACDPSIVALPADPLGTVHVVVGWNGDPASVAALRFAADLARRLHACLDVIHIEDLEDTPVDADADDWEEQIDARLDDLARTAKAELLAGVPAGWTYHVARGEKPARLLLRVATDVNAYAIVLGSPHGGIVGVLDELFGSRVARGVLAHNHRLPLIFVPAPAG